MVFGRNVQGCAAVGIALLASLVLGGCNDHPASAHAADPSHATTLPASLPATPPVTQLPRAVAASAELVATDAAAGGGFNRQYPWLTNYSGRDTIVATFIPPRGYERASVLAGTFARWLRNLPLRYSQGRLASAPAYAGVIDIDLDGSGPGGGCIGAIVRLRAEYMLADGEPELIRFGAGSGKWLRWLPPQSSSTWSASSPTCRPDEAAETYASFRGYLADVNRQMTVSSFTKSLARVPDLRQVRIGDVYLRTSGDACAAIVVDSVLRPSDGQRLFLLAQVTKGGREMVVLLNSGKSELGPWFEADSDEPIVTPMGSFGRDMLRRFRVDRGDGADDASQPTTNSAQSKAVKPTLAHTANRAAPAAPKGKRKS